MDDTSHVHRLPYEKVKLRLSALLRKDTDKLAFVTLSGSFNPVHIQHIRLLEAACAALQRSGWAVTAGFLSPSSDDYLKGKLSTGILSFERRKQLCVLATKTSEWLSVCPWGEFSSYRVCTRLREELERECAQILRGRSLTGVEVMGSDAAIRILDTAFDKWTTEIGGRKPWYRNRIVCCIIRPSPNINSDIEHIKRVTLPRAANLGVEVILVNTAREHLPLQAVSSTEIRELVARKDWDQLRILGWLPPQVLSALETWNRS
jgi:nicotinic acid mononucleotide adenylyltransferase